MRRWLALLMLVLLPLQGTWAAVADYCLPGSHVAADHVVHHDAGAPDDALADDASGPAEPDCSHCHGNCAGVMQRLAALEHQAHRQASPVLGDAPSAEHVPAEPDRPQWVRFA
jgi:hypothetical protein